MSCDPLPLMPKRLSASIAVIFSLFSAIPCAGAGNAERDIALLLGHESMALFYSEVGEPLAGSQTSFNSRLTISDYMSELDLVGVSYPTEPIGTQDNPAALASYGQTVIDSLDDVASDAFIVGWYGAISLAKDHASGDYRFPASIVCEHAQRAGFRDGNCTNDPIGYLRSILDEARSSYPRQ